MKNFTFAFAILSILFFAQSCANETSKHTDNAIALQPNDSLFQINEGGYSFNIILPKDLMIENTPSISVNSATGELNLQLGNQFWIVASLEKADMMSIKSELNSDMLFTSRIVEESDKSIFYQRILPDGTEYDYSFKCANEVGGKPYYFRTCEEGEFNMENVGRMKQAISSIHTSV